MHLAMGAGKPWSVIFLGAGIWLTYSFTDLSPCHWSRQLFNRTESSPTVRLACFLRTIRCSVHKTGSQSDLFLPQAVPRSTRHCYPPHIFGKLKRRPCQWAEAKKYVSNWAFPMPLVTWSPAYFIRLTILFCLICCSLLCRRMTMREQKTVSQLSPRQPTPGWLLHTVEKEQEGTDTLAHLHRVGVEEPSKGVPSGTGMSFCCIWPIHCRRPIHARNTDRNLCSPQKTINAFWEKNQQSTHWSNRDLNNHNSASY